MRAIVTLVAFVAALVWSVVVWGSYLVIWLTTEFVASGSAGLSLPGEIGQVASWVGSMLDSYGSGTALVIWLLGIGLILLLRKVLHSLMPDAPTSLPVANAPHAQAAPPPGPGGPAAHNEAPNQNAWGRDASRR